MRPVLGVSITTGFVRAVLVQGGEIRWAACAAVPGPEQLTDTIARLAEECSPPAHRVRLALERDVVQTRTIAPAPPVRAAAAARYVALEAPRLFRNGNGPMAVDGALVWLGRGERVLWAAAAAESLVIPILTACEQAGLSVESVGPAADVLPYAVQDRGNTSAPVFCRGGTAEMLSVSRGHTWRSRLVRFAATDEPELAPALARIGAEAAQYASAYGAAVAPARLQLLPAATRAARALRTAQGTRRLALAAVTVWMLAGATYAARIEVASRAATSALAQLAPAAESALAIRRDLATARAAMAVLDEAERHRVSHIAVIADLTAALGDSAVLVSLRLDSTGRVLLSGYAASAARVRAQLEQSTMVRDPQFDGPTDRQLVGDPGPGARQWDRFTLVGRLRHGT